jgi:mono/diheme cytochrome c family protein
MNLGRKWTIVLGIAIVIAAIAIYGMRLIQRGFSAREQPSVAEAFMAQKARRWAMPAGARNLKNPVPATAEMLEHGRSHWADHCATCHANNGSGQTEIGRNLYPKAPDMRGPATQSLSDGEIYYVIRNGVRMTGMPAWGSPADGDHDDDTWMLVLFIRHLPQLTASEEKEMEKFNPKSAAEHEEEREEEDFLSGKPLKSKH